ncbi:MAG: hypothetical protein IJS45_03065 [Clostridia bacterium]|nr:hypothetical protein [Clostridia bacterium]
MNNAIPARKSKLCTAAGIFFLIYAAINVLHLVIDYFIPGYPIGFSTVIEMIETVAIAGLAILMFAGIRNHAVTALFAVVAITEVITFIELISVYSDYGISMSGWGWATSICSLLGLIAASVFSAIYIIKGDGVSNGIANLWSLPGIFVLLATGVSIGVSAEYYFDTVIRRFFKSFSSGSFETIWENASVLLSTLILPICLGFGLLFAIRFIQKPNLNSLKFSSPAQGFVPGYNTGMGFNGGRGYAQPGYNPYPGYNPAQTYSQNPNPNQGYAAYQGYAPNQSYNPNQGYTQPPVQNYAPDPAPGYNPGPAPAEPKITGYDPNTGAPIYENAAPKIVGYDPDTGAPIYEGAAPKKIVGYDPDTGAPIYEGTAPKKIVGYDPDTGAPIYE